MNGERVRFFSIFCALVGSQLTAIRRQLPDMVLNLYIWVFCSLVIMGYIMQSFGLASDYGCFQFASILGTVGLFEIYSNVSKNVMDFDGDRNISYYLTLPTRPSVVLASYACYYAIIGVFLSFAALPFGKLILYNSFSFALVSSPRFVLLVILANIFFGVFTLMLTAHVGTMAKIRNIWSRFIFPVWILGCYQFSWAVVYKLSVPLAYVLLCNPLVFIMEGARASLLGQEGFLPWSVCCGALVGYTVMIWFHMYYKMKKLLDFV